MTPSCSPVLIFRLAPLPEALQERLAERCRGVPVSVLSMAGRPAGAPVPAEWKPLRVSELLDTDALRQAVLDFLDAWPRKELADGRCFDETFRTDGGYSVWWTGPGASRHQDKAVFLSLRAAWLLGRAIERVRPRDVLIYSPDGRLSAILSSRCRSVGCRFELLPGSAPPAVPWPGRARWLAGSLAWLALSPGLTLIRTLFARALAGRPREAAPDRQTPAVVMTSMFPRHVRQTPAGPELWYWKELAQAISSERPSVRLRYLLHTMSGRFGGYRMRSAWYHTGWRLLRRLRGLAAIPETNSGFRAFLRAVPGQVRAQLRYARLEGTPAFRESLTFDGADVSCLFVPLLRRSLARLAGWSRDVASRAQSLRRLGNVAVLLVTEEMYGVGMRDVAAARKVGAATVGVQHGAIYPMHVVYTLPPGQVRGAPVPDYFAVYGEFAKEVVTTLGAYPPERVRVTGSPRLDALVTKTVDAAAARKRLQLPPDKQVVLITTNFYAWFQDVARVAFEACKGRDDTIVCLKTHPKDYPLAVYRRIVEEVGAENVRLYDEGFEDLLAACDVLVGGFSTTVMEAILLGRKTICVDFSDEPCRYPYAADGGSLGAESQAEFQEALGKALSGAGDRELGLDRQGFLQRHLGPSAAGGGAEALAEVVAGLVEGDTPGATGSFHAG